MRRSLRTQQLIEGLIHISISHGLMMTKASLAMTFLATENMNNDSKTIVFKRGIFFYVRYRNSTFNLLFMSSSDRIQQP